MKLLQRNTSLGSGNSVFLHLDEFVLNGASAQTLIGPLGMTPDQKTFRKGRTNSQKSGFNGEREV